MLDIRNATLIELDETIAYHSRCIWWGNLWLGYAKFMFGFWAGALAMNPKVVWPTWLFLPFWLAFLLKELVCRHWKWLPKAE